jgi:6-phosphogluconolactonase
MRRQLLALTLFFGTASSVRADANLYVSLAGDQKIRVYRMASAAGELVHQADVDVDGGPGALTTDPRRRFLFASIRSKGQLASFQILPEGGKLKHLSTIPAGEDPAQLSTDRTGRYLLTAYYRAGKVTVHKIADDGSLDKEPLQSIPTAEKAHAIVADPSNRFVFVPHTAPNLIFQFIFSPATGRLAANAVPKLATPPATGPRHLVFHPSQPIAYVINEQGSSVTGYRLDESAGGLSPLQTITTLPTGFQGTNACAEIKVHPSGKFLYGSNRGHDSIACFAIDEAGKLTAIRQVATEKTPRSFDLDPSGRFLFAAGEESDRLASYRLDATTGLPQRLKTYNVGRQPWWVLAVQLPEEP